MSLAALEYRLTTLTALQGVVEALRSLTAVKQQKALALQPHVDAYARAAARALDMLAPNTTPTKRTAQVLMGPEGGFTGGLCGRLAAAVPTQWHPLVAGGRTAAAMQGRCRPMQAVLSIPGTIDALPALAAKLAHLLPPDAVINILHPQGHAIHCTDLPPLPDSAGRHDVLTQMQDGTLVTLAGLQDRQARLLSLLLVNYGAEQMARLATLTGARERIRDHIQALNVEISTARQDGISQEIADLWAGRSALHR